VLTILATPALAVSFAVALPAGIALASSETTEVGPEMIISADGASALSPVLDELFELTGPHELVISHVGGIDDLKPCEVNCGGGDDDDDDGIGDLKPCEVNCGGGDDEDGNEGGGDDGNGDDGGDPDDGDHNNGGNDGNGTEIPVPTRIDTGFGVTEDTKNELWLIGAVAAATGAGLLGHCAIRSRR
jgi:hypothetical protein